MQLSHLHKHSNSINIFYCLPVCVLWTLLCIFTQKTLSKNMLYIIQKTCLHFSFMKSNAFWYLRKILLSSYVTVTECCIHFCGWWPVITRNFFLSIRKLIWCRSYSLLHVCMYKKTVVHIHGTIYFPISSYKSFKSAITWQLHSMNTAWDINKL